MNKIIIAITGASGAIYAKCLLDKLVLHKDQYDDVAVVMSDNAKIVWETELNNNSYTNYPFTFYHKNDFNACFPVTIAHLKEVYVLNTTTLVE